jgi:hypothetical protein
MKTKLIAFIGLLSFAFGIPAFAAPTATGISSCAATNTSTATTILAANDQGSYGRKQLCLLNTSTTQADSAWCAVGGTGTITTGVVLPAAGYNALNGISSVPFCFPPAQQAAKTWPIVPSGVVSCIAVAGTPTVCAFDY